jgi:hypothetical protein
MNASQFMDKQILGLAAAGAASSPPSGAGGGGGGGELFDLVGPNPQEEDVVESHDDLHARRGGTGADEVVMPSYDFQPIRTTAAPAPAASAPAPNAWGSLDSNAASPTLKVIALGHLPADGAVVDLFRHPRSPANQANICSLSLFRSHASYLSEFSSRHW